jgi:hypothetical protein
VRRALKPIIGFSAVVGFAYIAFAIYANLFLMNCTYSQVSQAVSPNGEHFAVFDQRVCRDPTEGWSRVLMGKRGVRERDVLLEIRGTTQVGLTWNSDQELVVSYPRSASVKEYDLDFGRPRVTLRPTDTGS